MNDRVDFETAMYVLVSKENKHVHTQTGNIPECSYEYFRDELTNNVVVLLFVETNTTSKPIAIFGLKIKSILCKQKPINKYSCIVVDRAEYNRTINMSNFILQKLKEK